MYTVPADSEPSTGSVAHPSGVLGRQMMMTLLEIDRPFIVLTETKSSYRHIPVWARYSPHRTRVEAHANTLSP